MDFIFMLTRNDKTIEDGLDVVDLLSDFPIKHIGFKDVGVERAQLEALVDRIRQLGATSYMEVVSTNQETARRSMELAVELGVDRLLGGQDVEFTLDILKGSGTTYYPFPGRPVGHPTQLDGTPGEIFADCQRMHTAGCAGVDLLAYRATSAPPLDLVRAARDAMPDGYLIVAGSVNSPQRIHDLAEAGADAFTIGSAIFDGSFSPTKGTIRSQLNDVLAACQTPQGA